MTRTTLLITLAAAAALAGCNKDNNSAGTAGADNDTNVAANAPIALPPSITASKVYRCADNKVVSVDWLSDNKSANVRAEQGGGATQVTSAEPSKPMTAPGGYEVSGSAADASVTIAVPGHPSQSCKA